MRFVPTVDLIVVGLVGVIGRADSDIADPVTTSGGWSVNSGGVGVGDEGDDGGGDLDGNEVSGSGMRDGEGASVVEKSDVFSATGTGSFGGTGESSPGGRGLGN